MIIESSNGKSEQVCAKILDKHAVIARNYEEVLKRKKKKRMGHCTQGYKFK